jgi:hypothetical protein
VGGKLAARLIPLDSIHVNDLELSKVGVVAELAAHYDAHNLVETLGVSLCSGFGNGFNVLPKVYSITHMKRFTGRNVYVLVIRLFAICVSMSSRCMLSR